MFFDEMRAVDGSPRESYRNIDTWLANTNAEQLEIKRKQTEILFRRIGITFAVYGEGGDPERLIPFDIIPRIITAAEWALLEKGLAQRVNALNRYVADIYGPQEILKAGIIPEDEVLLNEGYMPEVQGVLPANGIYSHISGVDLVRVDENEFYVLEDNLRTPSGVSYVLENREVMMRLFPELFASHRTAPVENYPDYLLSTLIESAPVNCPGDPQVAVMTPGRFNSAYFEHSFLADKMGVPLVEGLDLFIEEDVVYMRTTTGPQRLDVIYRRLDDAFMDPLELRADSTLGVPGILNAYRAGNVTLANAVGAGIGDDKAIYTYVPEMINFYMGEKPILNNVPTWRCNQADDLKYVLDHLEEVVVKEVHGSGGYGMLVGPSSTKAEREKFAALLKEAPAKYIAQPTVSLSTCPTFVNEGVAPRHVDFRPFVLSGKQIRIFKGGLTRVALNEGSLVVNSSQGGGTKDTWVLEG